MIKKIISGAQTDVDQAALRVAIKLNIPHGGWCPKGRIAENGPIPAQYVLFETESSHYSVRTQRNISDSDGTLILFSKTLTEITDGTHLTIETCKNKNKPYLIVNISEKDAIESNMNTIRDWVLENKIETLNIAGPRESQDPGINQLSQTFLESLSLCTMFLHSYGLASKSGLK